MKRRRLCLYAVAIILMAAGCAAQTNGGTKERPTAAHLYNDRYEYAFDYPNAWKKTTQSGVLVLTSPRNDACIRISASSQDPHYAQEARKLTDALAHVEEETLHMQDVSCSTGMQVGNLPATDVVYTAAEVLSENDASKRKGRQVLIYGKELVYDLDLIARVEAFDAANTDFSIVLESFTVK